LPLFTAELDTEAALDVIGHQARERLAVAGFAVLAARSGSDADADEQQAAASPPFPPQELRILDAVCGSHGSRLGRVDQCHVCADELPD
jgi:hypothetical protein